MKRIVCWLLLVVCSAILAGCAGPGLSANQVAGIKRVAIISAIGQNLSLVDGRMFADGDTSVADISSWKLDGQLTDDLTQQLAVKYKVVPVTYQAADFAVEGVDLGDIMRTKTALPAGEAPVDAYIVIVPQALVIAGSSQAVGGPMLMRQPHIPATSYVLGVTCEAVVIDGHTFTILTKINAGPGRDVSESYWAPNFNALSETQRQQIELGLKESIRLIPGPILRVLNLVD